MSKRKFRPSIALHDVLVKEAVVNYNELRRIGNTSLPDTYVKIMMGEIATELLSIYEKGAGTGTC